MCWKHILVHFQKDLSVNINHLAISSTESAWARICIAVLQNRDIALENQ